MHVFLAGKPIQKHHWLSAEAVLMHGVTILNAPALPHIDHRAQRECELERFAKLRFGESRSSLCRQSPCWGSAITSLAHHAPSLSRWLNCALHYGIVGRMFLTQIDEVGKLSTICSTAVGRSSKKVQDRERWLLTGSRRSSVSSSLTRSSQLLVAQQRTICRRTYPIRYHLYHFRFTTLRYRHSVQSAR